MGLRSSRGLRAIVALVVLMTAAAAFAFPPVPRESAKALKVTRGKPFSAGMVFVNGKYVAPPYTVERWGTGIRINSIPVTGQVVDWGEFVKTQPGAKVEKTTLAPPAGQPAQSALESVTAESSESSSALDDLFDDKPAKPRKKPGFTPRVPKAPAAPKVLVTYSLSGDFVPNADSNALLKRLNDARTEVDRILRTGGFIFFGDRYSRVSGDKRALLAMLESLPEIQQSSESVEDFSARVRSANLVYINEVLCGELYENRVDYRKLKERRERHMSARKWEHVVEESADPIF